MARRKRTANGTPWHRKFDDAWYVTLDGKRHPLRDEHNKKVKGKDNRQAAELAVARLKLDVQPVHQPDVATIADVGEAYLEKVQREDSPAHYRTANNLINDLVKYIGPATPAMSVTKKQVKAWVDAHKGWQSDNTIKGNLAVVIACFNHAVKEAELLTTSPIAGLKKPTGYARMTFFTQEQIDEVIAHLNKPPKKKAVPLTPTAEFFQALLLTGARPFSELAKVTAENVIETNKGMVLQIKAGKDEQGNYRHKAARKTGKDRTIYLFQEAELLIRKLLLTAPKGSGLPLFRTPRGKAWRRTNGVTTFCAMKKALGWHKDPEKAGLSFYTCRHTFAKRILSGYYTGAPASMETVAGLLGNTIKVCEEHYAQWCDEYNEPLWSAVGRGQQQRHAS